MAVLAPAEPPVGCAASRPAGVQSAARLGLRRRPRRAHTDAMRTPKDLVKDALASEAEHTRRATALRRLVGGIRAQMEGVLSLSDKERKALGDACGLLEKMADVSKQAAALAKQRSVDRAGREKAIRLVMKANFACLDSVGDQVALIDAVNNEVLTGAVPNTNKLPRLRAEFNEAIDALARSLAREASDKRAETLVAEAWARFERANAATQARYKVLIDALLA